MKISRFIAQSYAVEESEVKRAFNFACERIEARTFLNEAFRHFDKADSAAASLESIAVLLKNYRPETTAAMEVITTAVITNLEAVGINTTHGFDFKSPEQRFQIATEGLGEWVSRIWKAIAAFMNRIWTWLKSFFVGSSKSEASVEKIEKITTIVRNFDVEEKKLIDAAKQGTDSLTAAARQILAERAVKIPNFHKNNESNTPQDFNKTAETSEKLIALYKNKNRDNKSDDLKIQGIIPAYDMGSYLSVKRVITELEFSEQVISQLLVQSVWVLESAESAMNSDTNSNVLSDFVNKVSPPQAELEKILECKMSGGGYEPDMCSAVSFYLGIDPPGNVLMKRISGDTVGHPLAFRGVFWIKAEEPGKKPREIPLLKEDSEFRKIAGVAETFKECALKCKKITENAGKLVKLTESYALEKSKGAGFGDTNAEVAKFISEAMVLYCVTIPTKMFTALEKLSGVLERYVEISAHNADPLVAIKYL